MMKQPNNYKTHFLQQDTTSKLINTNVTKIYPESSYHVYIDENRVSLRYQRDMEELFLIHFKTKESLQLMSKAFMNQRKLYKYQKAWDEYQADIIDEDQMDAIEEKLTISIDNNINDNVVNQMIQILFSNIDDDDFGIDELATILGVKRERVGKIVSQINTGIKKRINA